VLSSGRLPNRSGTVTIADALLPCARRARPQEGREARGRDPYGTPYCYWHPDENEIVHPHFPAAVQHLVPRQVAVQLDRLQDAPGETHTPLPQVSPAVVQSTQATPPVPHAVSAVPGWQWPAGKVQQPRMQVWGVHAPPPPSPEMLVAPEVVPKLVGPELLPAEDAEFGPDPEWLLPPPLAADSCGAPSVDASRPPSYEPS